MLPAKVRAAVRRLIGERLERLRQQLTMDPSPLIDALIAENARLVGDAGWMLDPEAAATATIVEHEDKARRYARVCVWDGECEADATTDDGLCAAHAEEQELEQAETRALVERGEIASEDAG